MEGRTNSISGLKLHVLGSPYEPASPADNTIWIETSDEITDWLIQYDEPVDPQEGLVWISTSINANTKINILWQHGVTFGFGTPKQWINSAWVTKTAKIRVNGGWADSQSFIYNSGAFNENYATSIQKNTSSGVTATVTTGDSYVSLYTRNDNGTSNRYSYFYFNNKIDLTNVKKIKFTWSATNQNSGYPEKGYRFVATTGNGANQWDSPTKGTAKTYSNPSVSSPSSIELNVESLTGENYVGVGQLVYDGSATIRIHAVELIL